MCLHLIEKTCSPSVAKNPFKYRHLLQNEVSGKNLKPFGVFQFLELQNKNDSRNGSKHIFRKTFHAKFWFELSPALNLNI